MKRGFLMELSKLKRNESAVVTEVAHPDPKMQQRLLDLGFYPGKTVKLVLISPKEDPKAYEVRGTVIAIRDEDANYIQVKTEEG
jgi:ferrous iron transport protein A